MGRAKASQRTWPKKAAATVLTPAILTPLVSVGLLAEAAGANSSQEVSFSIGGGTTCFMGITRQYPYAGDSDVGRGTTELTGGSGTNADTCLSSSNIVYVDGFWTDPFGQGVSATKTAFGTLVDSRFAPIGSGFSTRHQAYIASCNCFSPLFSLTK
jgi:hypothetical protein